VSNGRRGRRELSAAQQEMLKTLGPLDGERIAGGCAFCDAYQTVAPVRPGVWSMTVHHDDWCEFWNGFK